jgi:hypothetical protein
MAGRITEQTTLVGFTPDDRKGRITEQTTLVGFTPDDRKGRISQLVTLVARPNAEAAATGRSYVVMIG